MRINEQAANLQQENTKAANAALLEKIETQVYVTIHTIIVCLVIAAGLAFRYSIYRREKS